MKRHSTWLCRANAGRTMQELESRDNGVASKNEDTSNAEAERWQR